MSYRLVERIRGLAMMIMMYNFRNHKTFGSKKITALPKFNKSKITTFKIFFTFLKRLEFLLYLKIKHTVTKLGKYNLKLIFLKTNHSIKFYSTTYKFLLTLKS